MPQTYDDLTREALIEILKRRDRERKLGLVWERQEIEADHSINSDFLILDEIGDLSFGGPPRQNLVIEADNYDALRWLKTTHRGAIKFIYIDPPYNSGNKTFIYNDNYVDPEDTYRHSKWLEFMFQRLVLARDLLTPDGLIFVSIDDGEMARLRLLMDIVFPNQFQACLIWQSDGTGDNQGDFKVKHEYILVYSRDESQMSPPPVIDPNIDESASKLFNKEKRNSIIKNGPKNPVSSLVVPAGFPAAFDEGVIEPRNGPNDWPKHDEPIVVRDGKVATAVELRSGWSSRNLFDRFVEQGFYPVLDQSHQETCFEVTETGAIEYFKPRPTEQSYVISVINNVGSVQKTKSDLLKMGVSFDYPKPPGLIQYLLQMIPGNDFIALDFFAGTGTTGEAVMRLNMKDGGTRSFILVSSTEATKKEPNKNVCRDACAKRLKYFFEHDGAPIARSAPAQFGFTYGRVRRARLGALDEALSPSEIWYWVQQLHHIAPVDYNPKALVQAVSVNGADVLFVDRATPEAVKAAAEAASDRPAFIYSWSPGRFADSFEGKVAELRAIPDFFLAKLLQ